MSAPARKKGVSGDAAATHDQGAAVDSGQPRQSCTEQLCDLSDERSRRIRISLPLRHAKKWAELPPLVREEVARVAFGASINGVSLSRLIVVAAELREARIALTNALHFSLERGAKVDTAAIGAAVRRINDLLGGKL